MLNKNCGKLQTIQTLCNTSTYIHTYMYVHTPVTHEYVCTIDQRTCHVCMHVCVHTCMFVLHVCAHEYVRIICMYVIRDDQEAFWGKKINLS